MDYRDVIAELRDNSIPPIGSGSIFYEFDGLPLSDEFAAFHSFCQQHLNRLDMHYEIKPSRLYFSTHTGINACAYKYNGYGLIEVYKGTLFYLKQLYYQFTETLKTPPFSFIQAITKEKNIVPEHLLFQFSTQYFFYHELGHLIQRSSTNPVYLEFGVDNCKNENIIEKHTLEMDADCYAAYCMAMHLIQFSEKENDKEGKPDEKILYEVVAFALAGIYIYYVEISIRTPQLYFVENCHPHPSVRISYLIKSLLDNLSVNINYEFNQEIIFRKAMEFALDLHDTDKKITNYSKGLYERLDDVEGYIKTLIEYSKTVTNLALK